MRDLLFALGGFFAGGGAVIIYAKATGQEIEWRRQTFLRAFTQARYAHKHGPPPELR